MCLEFLSSDLSGIGMVSFNLLDSLCRLLQSYSLLTPLLYNNFQNILNEAKILKISPDKEGSVKRIIPLLRKILCFQGVVCF